jgi:hypothetical protein
VRKGSNQLYICGLGLRLETEESRIFGTWRLEEGYKNCGFGGRTSILGGGRRSVGVGEKAIGYENGGQCNYDICTISLRLPNPNFKARGHFRFKGQGLCESRSLATEPNFSSSYQNQFKNEPTMFSLNLSLYKD